MFEAVAIFLKSIQVAQHYVHSLTLELAKQQKQLIKKERELLHVISLYSVFPSKTFVLKSTNLLRLR